MYTHIQYHTQLHTLIMLLLILSADIKESSGGKSRHPSAPPGVIASTSPSNSPKSRSTFLLASLSSSRNAQTLPPEKSPGPQRDMKINKHATLPIQSAFTPISPNTPGSSTEILQSSSQTSLGSIDRLLTTPTTTACRVVTPTGTRANGSPAFTVSHTLPLTSSSCSNILSAPQTESPVNITKLVKPVRLDSPTTKTNAKKISKKDLTITIATTVKSSSESIKTTSEVSTATANVSTSSWAECSPPVSTDTSFYFSTHDSPAKITSTATPTSSVFRPIQSTPTKKDHNMALSPSLTQLYYGGGSQPPYRSYPISYTPTNFESPSPSPSMGARWQSSTGPLCTTPNSQTPTESDQCRKWLKVHRLHKYEHLFQDMTFSDISALTVDQLKDMGMTLGAAKKLQQKMEELK